MSDQNPDYKVKVNQFEFSFTAAEVAAADMRQITENEFHLIHNHQASNASLLETDSLHRKQLWQLDGERYEVDIKDSFDLMMDSMGFNKASGKQVKEIKAPMPGLVLEIAVTEGQEVKEGDKLLILVAMKMENSIQIHTGAVIKKIHIEVGQAVEKGFVLIELA